VRTALSREKWLGLVARSESEQPHEWPFVMAVVMNRVEQTGWPDAVHEVVLEPLQFSGFNDTYGDPDDKFEQVAARYPEDQLEAAFGCARWFLAIPALRRPFGRGACWFFSPRSMVPPGKSPAWAKALRICSAPGVDTWRFLFLERP
jgi:hypothetical protein